MVIFHSVNKDKENETIKKQKTRFIRPLFNIATSNKLKKVFEKVSISTNVLSKESI